MPLGVGLTQLNNQEGFKITSDLSLQSKASPTRLTNSTNDISDIDRRISSLVINDDLLLEGISLESINKMEAKVQKYEFQLERLPQIEEKIKNLIIRLQDKESIELVKKINQEENLLVEDISTLWKFNQKLCSVFLSLYINL